MKLFDIIKSTFRLVNCDIAFHPADPVMRRRISLLKHYGITTIIDVGANIGGFGLEIRDIGYTGKIISFEPQKKAFAELEINCKKSANWTAFNYGLGNSDSAMEINVSQNSFSSSILDMLPSHLSSAPQSEYIGKESIEIRKLDSVFKQFYSPSETYLLKIDTQGFERQVLEGAEDSLKHLAGIQLEMSMIPLYKGDSLFFEMDSYLNSKGFYLCGIETEFEDPATKKLLQINGIYFRTDDKK